MGAEKVVIIKDRETRLKASEHLLRDLKALEVMLEKGMFETDIQRIGAEQELSLIGNDWKPAPVLMQLLEKIKDERFTTEFARFNMEINLDPLEFKGECFSQLERNLWRLLVKGENAARSLDAHLILVGILPTLRLSDIDLKNLTPLPRYRNLIDSLLEARGDSFEFRIEGADQWISRANNSFFESSNTSFQVHYQLPPGDFAPAYNWSLAVTAPLMAVSTNSPLLLGKRLWRETRIALFQQSTDVRSSSATYREQSPRVSFGNDWVKNSVLDLYRDDAIRHKLLLATTFDEDPQKVLAEGGIPRLYQLCVHNGTIYNWNRPCYGIIDGKPHLRIENRIMPAGPTIIDEVANAAFWLGLMKGLPQDYIDIATKLDFAKARSNFNFAARSGLGASFHWPGCKKPVPAEELITKELLPIAKEGLQKAGIIDKDTERLLNIIRERTESGRTGAQWILSAFEKLQKDGATKDEALVALTAGMSRRQQEGSPVHTWDLPGKEEAGNWRNRFWTIEQIMKTDLFTVTEDVSVNFVANLMFWRNIRHVPVENARGELTGLVTCKILMFFYSNNQGEGQTTPVKEIMTTNLITISPQTKTSEAIRLIRKHDVGCLPVVQGERLVGLVTERDFVNVTADLLGELNPESISEEQVGEQQTQASVKPA